MDDRHRIKKIEISEICKRIIDVIKGKILIYVMSMISSIYLARTLLPEGRGNWAVITSISALIVQFCNLGLHSAHTYYVSKDKNKLAYSVGNNIFITGITMVVCLLIGVWMYFFPEHISISYQYLIAALLLAPNSLFLMLQENISVAEGNIKKYNIMQFMDCSLYIIIIFTISFLVEINVFMVAVCSVLSTLLINVFSIWPYFKKKIILFSPKYLLKVINYALKSYIACLVVNLVLRIDIMMLNAFVNGSEVGYYSLAVNLSEMLYFLSSSISLVLFPHLSKLSDKTEKIELIKKVYIYGGTITIICAVTMEGLAPYLIPYLYGKLYSAAIPVMRILIIAIVFWSLASFAYSYFSSEGKLFPTIIIPIITLIINIVCNILWIPKHGIMGAANASLVSYIFNCVAIILSMIYDMKS